MQALLRFFAGTQTQTSSDRVQNAPSIADKVWAAIRLRAKPVASRGFCVITPARDAIQSLSPAEASLTWSRPYFDTLPPKLVRKGFRECPNVRCTLVGVEHVHDGRIPPHTKPADMCMIAIKRLPDHIGFSYFFNTWTVAEKDSSLIKNGSLVFLEQYGTVRLLKNQDWEHEMWDCFDARHALTSELLTHILVPKVAWRQLPRCGNGYGLNCMCSECMRYRKWA